METLTVQTISVQCIKPSSPQPRGHRTTVDLSLLDQLSPHIYTHLILFYSPSSSSSSISDKLKSSLSDTLVHFYPLAGTIKVTGDGTIYIDCTDEGVMFIEAETKTKLDSVIGRPAIGDLVEFLPIKKSSFCYNDALLAIQFTRFRCGGFAVGVSISHVVADGVSTAAFLDSWSCIARDCRRRIADLPPRFDDAVAAFPPRQWLARHPTPNDQLVEVAIKRFVIPPHLMNKLKAKAAAAPTRVEAALGLVWRSLMRAQRQPPQPTSPSVSHVVNLRSKMSPLLTAESFGNLWLGSVASISNRESLSHEEALRAAVKKVNGIYARAAAEGLCSGDGGKGGVKWIFSSWCRLPLYEVDFGGGRPAWVGCGIRDMKDVCILMDTRDGGGVEVWLWLAAEEMERVERDPEFRSFVCVVD